MRHERRAPTPALGRLRIAGSRLVSRLGNAGGICHVGVPPPVRKFWRDKWAPTTFQRTTATVLFPASWSGVYHLSNIYAALILHSHVCCLRIGRHSVGLLHIQEPRAEPRCQT